jgi:hypothetical protein
MVSRVDQVCNLKPTPSVMPRQHDRRPFMGVTTDAKEAGSYRRFGIRCELYVHVTDWPPQASMFESPANVLAVPDHVCAASSNIVGPEIDRSDNAPQIIRKDKAADHITRTSTKLSASNVVNDVMNVRQGYVWSDKFGTSRVPEAPYLRFHARSKGITGAVQE